MKNCPDISIILPIFNGEKYLVDSITSLLEQDFINFEILGINDGSSDGTAAILDSFAKQDNRIKVLSGENRGLVAALNWGLREAKANIIARMDADDIAYKNRLSLQWHFLQNNPDVGLVFSQMRKIDAAGRPTGKITNTLLSAKDVKTALAAGNCLPHHPTIMARKAAMINAGGYREIFKHAEDLDLWYRMSKQTKLVGLSDILLDYRLHPEQVSHRQIIRQRFSQDLIILVAKELDSGRPDPSQHWTEMPEFNSIHTLPQLSKIPAAMLTLFKFYDIINQILNRNFIKQLPCSDLIFVFETLNDQSFFGSAKMRQVLYHHLVQSFIQRRKINLAIKGMFYALKLNPSRALRHHFHPF